MHNIAQIEGIHCHKHFFTLPLDYSRPQGPTISVFARELRGLQTNAESLPILLYFQGGPGFAAQRPLANSGWIKRALQEYRVLLLDQRGTGLSSPVSFRSLAGMTASEQAQYLSHFRADNIVRDAEAIRQHLCPDTPWSVLGQSFGGFCILRYLSSAAHGLKEAYITGGIPSLSRTADEVYRATYSRVLTKNRDFFRRFPDAQPLLNTLADHLRTHEEYLPNGDLLTVEMLQLLGINLGMMQGAEAVYYLLEQALIDGPEAKIVNPLFADHFTQLLSYHTNPLYVLLHEAIYCQQSSSNWAAHRIRAEYPEFSPDASDLLLTGEMVYPWMMQQISNLQPLQPCAELLASKQDWPMLYDARALASNTVPVTAAIYSEDMYVEREFSLETAASVAHLKYWLTSEYEHNGIRMDGEHILDRLIALNRGHQLR
ncbi:alpha/beta fold hydrolase [Shewanella sp. A32]|uniref:alpha/beta fold hydrolase n=1 Tax=Shewanella sp. A32 TaxID=3031327 RepID=UPI0023B9758F|nr:alpha/beta fold hydrolase [Shewanella sp. A32]MDF0533617.1 alpha/beta fold hydrolase [Shewanella sp. A32]